MRADKFLQKMQATNVAPPEWRPYKDKKNLFRYAKATAVAAVGYGLSTDPSYQSLTVMCSIVALCEMYKVWASNKKDKTHQTLLSHIETQMAQTYKSTAPEDVKKVYARLCINDTDTRNEFRHILQSNMLHSEQNKNKVWTHDIAFFVDQPLESSIKIATLTATIRILLQAAMVGHQDCEATIKYDIFEGKDTCLISVTDPHDNGETPIVLKQFAANINFMFNDEWVIPKLEFSQFKHRLKVKEAFVINSPGEWKLEDGNVLEVQQSKNQKSFDVSVYVPQTGTRGMTIEHNGLDSINKTWGHLVLNTYSQDNTPSM